jgi:hypothetical protein
MSQPDKTDGRSHGWDQTSREVRNKQAQERAQKTIELGFSLVRNQKILHEDTSLPVVKGTSTCTRKRSNLKLYRYLIQRKLRRAQRQASLLVVLQKVGLIVFYKTMTNRKPRTLPFQRGINPGMLHSWCYSIGQKPLPYTATARLLWPCGQSSNNQQTENPDPKKVITEERKTMSTAKKPTASIKGVNINIDNTDNPEIIEIIVSITADNGTSTPESAGPSLVVSNDPTKATITIDLVKEFKLHPSAPKKGRSYKISTEAKLKDGKLIGIGEFVAPSSEISKAFGVPEIEVVVPPAPKPSPAPTPPAPTPPSPASGASPKEAKKKKFQRPDWLTNKVIGWVAVLALLLIALGWASKNGWLTAGKLKSFSNSWSSSGGTPVTPDNDPNPSGSSINTDSQTVPPTSQTRNRKALANDGSSISIGDIGKNKGGSNNVVLTSVVIINNGDYYSNGTNAMVNPISSLSHKVRMPDIIFPLEPQFDGEVLTCLVPAKAYAQFGKPPIGWQIQPTYHFATGKTVDECLTRYADGLPIDVSANVEGVDEGCLNKMDRILRIDFTCRYVGN